MVAKNRKNAKELKSSTSTKHGMSRDSSSGSFLNQTSGKNHGTKSSKAVGGLDSLPLKGRVFKVNIDSAGRILVPAKVRRVLDVEPGDEFNLELKGDVLEIRSLDDVIRDAKALVRRYVPQKRQLVDELIAERRADAKRE